MDVATSGSDGKSIRALGDDVAYPAFSCIG
jgi:hypothetical protein